MFTKKRKAEANVSDVLTAANVHPPKIIIAAVNNKHPLK